MVTAKHTLPLAVWLLEDRILLKWEGDQMIIESKHI